MNESIEELDPGFKFSTGILIALAVIAGQIIGVIIGLIVAAVVVGGEFDQLQTLGTGIGLVVSFPIAVWIILRKRTLADTAFTWNNSFIYLLFIGLLMTYGVSYIVGGLLEYAPGYDAMLEQYASMFDDINPMLLLLGGTLVGPICEEIIFRGVILKGFLKSYSPNTAIVLSAVIFGVIHLIPLQVVSAFFIGIVLGWIYYKTQSLWLPILIHIIHNSIAFLIGLDHLDESMQDYFSNELIYYLSFLIAAAVVWCGYVLFERASSEKESKGIV